MNVSLFLDVIGDSAHLRSGKDGMRLREFHLQSRSQ